jgi:uncharacterized protein (UPF0305 family)
MYGDNLEKLNIAQKFIALSKDQENKDQENKERETIPNYYPFLDCSRTLDFKSNRKYLAKNAKFIHDDLNLTYIEAQLDKRKQILTNLKKKKETPKERAEREELEKKQEWERIKEKVIAEYEAKALAIIEERKIRGLTPMKIMPPRGTRIIPLPPEQIPAPRYAVHVTLTDIRFDFYDEPSYVPNPKSLLPINDISFYHPKEIIAIHEYEEKERLKSSEDVVKKGNLGYKGDIRNREDVVKKGNLGYKGDIRNREDIVKKESLRHKGNIRNRENTKIRANVRKEYRVRVRNRLFFTRGFRFSRLRKKIFYKMRYRRFMRKIYKKFGRFIHNRFANLSRQDRLNI